LPAGVTASFSPNPTTGSGIMTLTVSSTAALGTATVTMTGTSGTLTASTTFTLGVYAPTFTISTNGSLNIGQGTTSTSYVNINPQYGFKGAVDLTVSGLPAGVTASFSPNPTTGSGMVTLTASSTAAFGTATVTITGTSGTLTVSTTLAIGVYVPGFTISPSSANLGVGTSTTDYIYVNPQYGFTGSVNLTASGLPSGVTASWIPNPTTGASALTLTASNTVTPGQYNVTIKGTSGTLTATTTLALGVYAPSFILSAGSASLGQGATTTTYVSVNPQYGFIGSVNLTASGLPAGVTASFAPNPTTGSCVMTLTASSTTVLGQYNVTINGTSGTQAASTTFSLGVFPQGFTLSSSSASLGQGGSGTSYVYVNPLGQYTAIITGTSGILTVTTTITVSIYAPGFTIADYSSVSVGQGNTGTTYVNVTPQYGFSGSVSLAVSGLRSGVTASFAPNPISTGSTVLTLTASSTSHSRAVQRDHHRNLRFRHRNYITSCKHLRAELYALGEYHDRGARRLQHFICLRKPAVWIQRQRKPCGIGLAQRCDCILHPEPHHRLQHSDFDGERHSRAGAV
jgi:hypothetical protein